MSRLFLLFLIALLPLRGWTAQRMVLDMETPAAVVSMAQQTGMSEDCAAHMQVAANAQANADPQGAAHTGCHACDICMPLATLDEVSVMDGSPAFHAVPVLRLCAFDSADAMRYAKPPIC
jgi:hypothetical protein